MFAYRSPSGAQRTVTNHAQQARFMRTQPGNLSAELPAYLVTKVQRKINAAAAPSELRPAWSAAQVLDWRRASGPTASGTIAISLLFGHR